MTFDPSFASTSMDYDQLIAGHKPPAKAVPIVLTDGETVVRGSVLGQVTTNEKYLVSLAAATDGSEVARAIAAVAASPSGADETILAYVEGEFNQDELTFGTGKTIANSKQELMDKNIYIVDPVTKTPA
jgi:hypothetical protein